MSEIGLRGILKNYSSKDFVRSLVLPIGLTTILLLSFQFSSKGLYNLLEIVTDLSISIIPNLLGFLFGVYALIIGFSNIDLLKKMALYYPDKTKNISLYQKTSAIFSFVLISMIFTLVLGFSTKIIIWFDLNNPPWFHYDVRNVINGTALFLLLFLINYSIMSLLDAVRNVFNFTQSFQKYLNLPENENKDGESKNK